MDLSGPGVYDGSPFTTTFAVLALAECSDARAQEAARRGVAFLLAERRDPGVWTYWSKRNPKRISPDMDVTSCAAFVVRRFAPDRHSDAIDPILLANQTVRGRFKTWLREFHERNDVSPCVNANALLYLGDCAETRQASRYLIRLMERGPAGSDWYYADPNALYYMLSRAYAEGVESLAPCAGPVSRAIEAAELDTPLAQALALCALTNFSAAASARATRLAEALRSSQAEDGGWPAAPFYAGPEPPEPHAYWWGSRALTTAIGLEALARLNRLQSPGAGT